MVGSDGSLFGIGSKVEVRSDEEGFKGSWFKATILDSSYKSVYKKKKKVSVEYETLVTEDGSSPLVENVDPAFIRPLPPEEDSGCQDFEVNEKVDAWYRDGWWVGTVRKVLEGSRYRIYFDNPPDVIEFDRKDLRLHLDWVSANWVRPSKEQMAESIFSSGATVEVNPDSPSLCDVWFPAIVVKDYGDNDFLVKYISEYGEEDEDAGQIHVDLLRIRPIPPPYRIYELHEKVDASYSAGWRAGVISKVLADGRYNVLFEQGNEDKELSHSEIRPRLEWIDGKWINASKKAKSQNVDGPGCLNICSAIRKKRVVESTSNTRPVSAAGKKNKTRDITSICINEDGRQVAEKTNDPAGDKSAKNMGDGQKRKRGKPRKSNVKVTV